MAGYMIENALPAVTVTLHNFLQPVTGLRLASHLQQIAGEDFRIARQTDGSGDSYLVGVSPSSGGECAVVPDIDKPWIRPDERYDLLHIVTCRWSARDNFIGIVALLNQVAEVAGSLEQRLCGRSALDYPDPRYRRVTSYHNIPGLRQDIFVF